MHADLQRLLSRIIEWQTISADEMEQAVSLIMQGEVDELSIAAFLVGLRTKGEDVEEIVGAARAMHAHATPIPTDRGGLLDTCGTGGDRLHTFNISTATALVTAAVGVPVAKHGNRSVSSRSGSADVLETLGVNINLTPEQVADCLEQIGIGFCFAPLLHGAMKYAAPVRKKLGIPTIFNLLGPLTNPANAEYQLLGTPTVEIAEKLAFALAQLHRKRALVVCGNGELDEVSLWGTTTALLVENGEITPHRWTAASFELPECDVAPLKVASAEESAALIRRILYGEPGAPRDMVLANTAAALFAVGLETDPVQGMKRAAETIDSGKARQLCDELIALTNSYREE